MSLGRFQLGQSVPLSLSVVNSGGSPVWPDAAPTATITDSGSHVIAEFKMAMTGASYVFSADEFLGLDYTLGTYSLSYQWFVGGSSVSASDSFDVAPGGDAGGRVISMYAYSRPEASYVVGQLSSGNIVQGRNPRL